MEQNTANKLQDLLRKSATSFVVIPGWLLSHKLSFCWRRTQQVQFIWDGEGRSLRGSTSYPLPENCTPFLLQNDTFSYKKAPLGADHQISGEGGMQGKVARKKNEKERPLRKMLALAKRKNLAAPKLPKKILHKKTAHPPPRWSDGAPLIYLDLVTIPSVIFEDPFIYCDMKMTSFSCGAPRKSKVK